MIYIAQLISDKCCFLDGIHDDKEIIKLLESIQPYSYYQLSAMLKYFNSDDEDKINYYNQIKASQKEYNNKIHHLISDL